MAKLFVRDATASNGKDVYAVVGDRAVVVHERTEADVVAGYTQHRPEVAALLVTNEITIYERVLRTAQHIGLLKGIDTHADQARAVGLIK
jgi:hypothetical protein